jgi:hypothetical protein
VIVLAGLGFVIATLNAATRVLFMMGRDQVLPGSLARLCWRQAPAVAIGYLAVITSVAFGWLLAGHRDCCHPAGAPARRLRQAGTGGRDKGNQAAGAGLGPAPRDQRAITTTTTRAAWLAVLRLTVPLSSYFS